MIVVYYFTSKSKVFVRSAETKMFVSTISMKLDIQRQLKYSYEIQPKSMIKVLIINH